MVAAFRQLSIEERRRIERWRRAKVPVQEMARVLKRSKSTSHRKFHKPRRARKCLPPKFDHDVSILFRPDDIARRRQFGHWKGYLMLFK